MFCKNKKKNGVSDKNRPHVCMNDICMKIPVTKIFWKKSPKTSVQSVPLAEPALELVNK